MSDTERLAFEAALNTWLQHAIVVFCLTWWAQRAWKKAKLPGIDWRHYLTWAPRTPPAPEPAPHQPCTPVRPRAHAVQPDPQPVRAPSETPALTPQIVGVMRLIAAHKLMKPADSKTATARALGVSRSGTSERYAVYSAAWGLLYPEPAEAPGPEFVSERDERVQRELASG